MSNKKIIGIGVGVYMLCCGVVGYNIASIFDNSERVTINKNVQVRFTNTLWETVGDTMDVYGDQRDIRRVIYDTIKVNNMSQTDWQTLSNNDVIVVPVQYERKS